MTRSGRLSEGSGTVPILAGLVVLAGVLSVAGVVAIRVRSSPAEVIVRHAVQRGPFVHEVVERGEIESSRNVEIRCEVKSRNSGGTAILEVIDEGTLVQPGDLLLRLDSSALQQERVQQQIICNTAEALMIQARNDFEAAVIAKKEYLEGMYHQEEQTLQSEVFVAEENLRRAQQYLQYSERLAARGFVTSLQLEGDRFAVEKATNDLEAARTKLRVLQEYTKAKMVKELEAKIKTTEAQWKSTESSYQLELSKLREIEDQIAKCEIRAPQAGQVVYANDYDRRGDEDFIVEPGALVRERQIIIRLPDATAMQVKAKINEARITLIKPGMPVMIHVDAIGDQELMGEVTRVNEYPEPSSWYSSQVKEYASLIRIFDPPASIRPGLTAEVRIIVDQREDVLNVPVQAVHEHGGRFYCMVLDHDRWQARLVQLGASNDKFVVVHAGLAEGDQVAMDPRALLGEVSLPQIDVRREPQPIARSDHSPDGPKSQTGVDPDASESAGTEHGPQLAAHQAAEGSEQQKPDGADPRESDSPGVIAAEANTKPVASANRGAPNGAIHQPSATPGGGAR